MTVAEILVALVLPPLAVRMRPGTTGRHVAIAFLLWVAGWVPGVIYALRIVTAEPADVPGSDADPYRDVPSAALRARRRRRSAIR